MKRSVKTLALCLALAVLLLGLSACFRGGWFSEHGAVEIFHNSRWESEDGKMTLFVNTREPYAFGYIVKDGETIPFLFESWLYGECWIQSVGYFDGKETVFEWDETVDHEPTFYLAADSHWYWRGDKDLTLTFDEPEKAAALGLPEKIDLSLREQDITGENMKKEYPPIHLPPHYDLYDEYLALSEMTYDEVLQALGVCESYRYVSDTKLECYYPVKAASGELLYWYIAFPNNGQPHYYLPDLIAPEDIPEDVIVIDKSGVFTMPPLQPVD